MLTRHYYDLPEYCAHVRECAARPDVDDYRLILADRLADQWSGFPGAADHAALIRAGVELAALNQTPRWHEECDLKSKCPCVRLDAAVRVLAARLPDPLFLDWAAETPNRGFTEFRVVPPAFAADWHRGFPETIRCSAADWLAHGATLRRRYVVRDVGVRGMAAGGMIPSFAGLRSALVTVSTTGGWGFFDYATTLPCGCHLTVRYEAWQGVFVRE
jgi:hypothetical protein